MVSIVTKLEIISAGRKKSQYIALYSRALPYISRFHGTINKTKLNFVQR